MGMVKCTCGSIFHNMGKMNRHLLIHHDDPTHTPRLSHDTTKMEFAKYTKTHKKGKVNIV